MITDIVFLIEVPFTEWYLKRFGIRSLESNGLRVTVVDVTDFIFPKYTAVFGRDIVSFDRHYIVRTKADLIDVVFNLPRMQTIVFDHLGYTSRARFIRACIGKAKLFRGTWNLGVMPLPIKMSKLNSFIHAIRKKNLFLRSYNRLCRWYTELQNKPHLVLLGGSKSCNGPFINIPNKIWSHSFDYEEYLAVNESEVHGLLDYNYIVYLDEDIPGHPDYLHAGIISPTSNEKFYPALDRIFKLIENAFGMPIVIARHPKSSLPCDTNWFYGRKVIDGQSALLVKYSNVVIGHASCSHSFAVLWKKPLILLTSNDLNNSFLGGWIASRGMSLDKIPINIDDVNVSNDEIMKQAIVNQQSYEYYKDAFIKRSGSMDGRLWDIFAQRIKTIAF